VTKHPSSNEPIAQRIDASGLLCPHPVLRARAALHALAPGALLELIATDPLASLDVHAFCLRAGHELVREDRDGQAWRFLIRKGVRVIFPPTDPA
jgi:tRNA 2-thiouridine synthesizing protein A